MSFARLHNVLATEIDRAAVTAPAEAEEVNQTGGHRRQADSPQHEKGHDLWRAPRKVLEK